MHYKNKIYLILFTILIINNNQVLGQEHLILNKNINKYIIRPYTKFLVDSTKKLNLEDVLTKDFQFINKAGNKKNFPMSENVYWYKIQIENGLDETSTWILEFDHSLTENIQLYLLNSKGDVLSKKKGGLKYNHSEIDLLHETPSFPLYIGSKESYTIYLRIDTRSAVYSSIYLYRPSVFWVNEMKEKSFMLFLFGIIFALAIFNFVLYLSTKEKAYVFLSLFLVSSIWLFASTSGYFYELFPNLPITLKIKARVYAYWLSLTFLALFITTFLELKKNFPRNYYLSFFVISFYILNLFISAFDLFPYIFSYKLVIYSYPIFVLIFIIIGTIVIKEKKTAVYFMIPFSMYIGSSIIFILVILGVLDKMIIYDNISSIGTALFGLLFTAAFIKKMDKLKEDQMERQFLKKETYRLNEEVKLRIDAEKSAKQSEQKLKKANDSKNKFFSIIAHDLKTPINNVLGYSELLKDSINDNYSKKVQKHVDFVYIEANNTVNLLENLLSWSKTEKDEMKYHPERVDLNTLMEDMVEAFDKMAESKGIEIVFDPKIKYFAIGDTYMLQTVVRNLINNSIKFSSTGKITIQLENKGIQCIISIIDEGVGMTAETIEAILNKKNILSAKGTNGELGNGLGLMLINDFINNHGSVLQIESSIGKGSTFSFVLKLSKNKYLLD